MLSFLNGMDNVKEQYKMASCRVIFPGICLKGFQKFSVGPNVVQSKCLGMDERMVMFFSVSLKQLAPEPMPLMPIRPHCRHRRLYSHMGFLCAANNVQDIPNLCSTPLPDEFPNMLVIWNTLQGAIVMTPWQNPVDNDVRSNLESCMG